MNDRESVDQYKRDREAKFREHFGAELNWKLAFDHLTEKDTTKHVHRLMPLVGKYIPQIPEYFLNGETDEFKQEAFFKPGDIVLDPFSGSGTTAVQAAEMGIHCLGIELSSFHRLVSMVKLRPVDLRNLGYEVGRITRHVSDFIAASGIDAFNAEADALLKDFNDRHFPKPEFKRTKKEKFGTRKAEIEYGDGKLPELLPDYSALCEKHGVSHEGGSDDMKWFPLTVRSEFEFAKQLIDEIADSDIRDVLTVVMCRTMRSCRATTHFDLGSPVDPVRTPYYCFKHSKVCRPIMTMKSRFGRYANDALTRLTEYDGLRQAGVRSLILQGDSRNIDILPEIEKVDKKFCELIQKQKISGIFCSPPYIGVLDYHANNAVSHHLFGFERRDDEEIGPKFKG